MGEWNWNNIATIIKALGVLAMEFKLSMQLKHKLQMEKKRNVLSHRPKTGSIYA